MRRWMVLVEAAGDASVDRVTGEDVATLAKAAGACGALCTADRYGVQLEVEAYTHGEAASAALARLAAANHRLGLPTWDVVRVEVSTPEDFERGVDESLPEATAGSAVAPTALASPAEDLLRQAFTDALTGLPTRALFLDRVAHALARAPRTGCTPIVVFCNPCSLEEASERFGPAGGDAVLTGVANRLLFLVRPGDTVGRVTAADFAVLVEESSGEGATAVAERVLAALRTPLEVDGQTFPLNPAVGVALPSPGESAEELLHQAETAVHRVREGASERGGAVVLSEGSSSAPPEPDAPTGAPSAIQDRLAGLLLLQQAAVTANQSDTLEEAVTVLLPQLCAHSGWPVGHLFRAVGHQAQLLVPSGVWHLPSADRYRAFQQATHTFSPQTSRSFLGRVVSSGLPCWISDVTEDPNFCRAGHAVEAGLKGGLAFPVLAGSEVVGVIELYNDEPAAPSSVLLDVLAAVGMQLGRVVERSRAAAALRQSEEGFRRVAESAFDAMVVIDQEGRIASWNSAAAAMFGYGEDEVVGRSAQVLLRGSVERPGGGRGQEPRIHLVAGAAPLLTEVELRRSDGSTFPAEMSLSTWATSEGRFFGAVLRDITERKRSGQGMSRPGGVTHGGDG